MGITKRIFVTNPNNPPPNSTPFNDNSSKNSKQKKGIKVLEPISFRLKLTFKFKIYYLFIE
jgi:hypothetical protein